MTNRERTLRILRFQSADRLPAVHFGYWRELLTEWADQGHISRELATGVHDGNEYDRELDRLLGWDFNWATMRGANTRLFPRFERTVLETLPDGMQRVQNDLGVIERIKPGVVSIPAEDDYLLKDRETFERLYKPKMQFDPARVNVDFFKTFNETRPQDIPVGLWLGSILGDIRSITTVLGMSYLLYDEDETLFKDIVDTYADMQYQCAKTILETGAKFDFAHFWEDICFKNGPLLSPVMFEELCGTHYRRMSELCNSYGIDLISLDCDGVTDQLLPTWVNHGVNVMFPIEVGVWGDQFEPARKKFGNRVLGVGGMDKTAFRKDRAAIDAELDRLAHLTQLGGFIPCPDHRLMPGSKIELVRYYTERIKEIRL